MSGLRSSCIFCDDVRQEVSGKHSFIGVYADSLIINASSDESKVSGLPKFFIVCSLKNLDKRKNYSILIEQTGVEKKERKVSEEAKKSNNRLTFVLQMLNFAVPKEGTLKVSLLTGDTKLLIDELEIIIQRPKK